MLILKTTFLNLAQQYTSNQQLTQQLWEEIYLTYSNKNRHYHNLTHLEKLLEQLLEVKELIEDWETTMFAVYYHDIVYKSTSSQNEEHSAELAEKRLMALNYPIDQIEKCKKMILATKGHTITYDNDTDYFTDADLSILGQSWEVYYQYAIQVRKEFALYPDILYNPGRKKVLKHFLNLERLYKTSYFYEKFEKQARENLKAEILLY